MANEITIRLERCTWQINIDAFFTRATLAKQKKLMDFMFREPCRNKKAVDCLSIYLTQKQAEAKDSWNKAVLLYQNGYRNTQFSYGITANEKRRIEQRNKQLMTAVKRCKAEYERRSKILTYFDALKTKNNI